MRPILSFCLSTLLLSSVAAAADPPVDFQNEIRPILSDNCFHCHGPDADTRMAGLRLDEHDAAIAERPNGAAIVPGDSAASLLHKRITATDALKMPPEYSHKKLEPEQIELLTRWIDQGAKWSEQWAFVAPKPHEPPRVQNESWVRNPIDNFILAALEKEGLSPAKEADRRSLIRRVSFDLTGLPPEPADVEAFVADKSPDAYEKVVDRLLASPAWGEHRARYWLDAARYADTHSLHIDNYREMWPYRDWVIEAFNQNMPFDEFTVEQIAGDLLPNPAIPTHRNRVPPLQHHHQRGRLFRKKWPRFTPRIGADTTGAVWLGLTVGCATCRDHKFDPIKQKDFPALTAFFHQHHPEAARQHLRPAPVMIVPSSRTARAGTAYAATCRLPMRSSTPSAPNRTKRSASGEVAGAPQHHGRAL
ncbi:MAG: DUF1549 domain-containing protein [Bryobacterales bacterium]